MVGDICPTCNGDGYLWQEFITTNTKGEEGIHYKPMSCTQCWGSGCINEMIGEEKYG